MTPDDFAVPLSSGFRRLSDEEQERHRKQHREMQRRLQPFFDQCDYLRRRAEAESRSAFIA